METANSEKTKQCFTIRIEFDNTPEAIELAKWIWQSMSSNQTVNGIRVSAMRNGDGFKAESIKDNIIGLYERYDDDLDDDDLTKIDELTQELEKTWERYI
jgi:hypothetical protein